MPTQPPPSLLKNLCLDCTCSYFTEGASNHSAALEQCLSRPRAILEYFLLLLCMTWVMAMIVTCPPQFVVASTYSLDITGIITLVVILYQLRNRENLAADSSSQRRCESVYPYFYAGAKCSPYAYI